MSANRSTIPVLIPIEFDGIKKQAGLNSFILTVKQWAELTGAIGLVSKAGRYGGTYAHKDIAFEFASWISVEFKLYLIKEFQRLKDEENDRLKLDWNLQRTLAKINYRIHTDAIKDTLIPPSITKAQASAVYASEADLLSVTAFPIGEDHDTLKNRIIECLPPLLFPAHILLCQICGGVTESPCGSLHSGPPVCDCR